MKDRTRILINLFTAVVPFAAWMSMFNGPAGVLSSRGMSSLKYFTVLSNLLEGIASACWLMTGLFRKKRVHWAEVLKFIAGVCVFLTLFVVMVFLGPRYGFPGMFQGANLWLHLVVPLAAVFELLFLVKERISLKETVFAVIPVMIYGTFYLGNILVNGVGDMHHWNDFYGFLTWGLPAGISIFAVICVTEFLVGLLFRRTMKPKKEV